MLADLPAEIWTQIFDLAADEDILFQQGIPTVMAESAWYKNVVGMWNLRTPQEALNMLQRRSYATKKAIISTCRQWRELGSEFLFRCLHFSDPKKLLSLCSILDSSAATATTATSSYGWWTRRIHLSRHHPSSTGQELSMADLENVLVSIIRHCPNLEIFIVERPMGTAFGPVADALATYAFRKLHTVQWSVPGESLSKVIWALNALPLITSVHIDFDSSVPTAQECAHLGSATDIHLELPFLEQLSLQGYVEEFIEQAAGWDLPGLRSFSFDSGTSPHDPDIVEFVKAHGLPLILLDLNCVSVLDVATILGLCPNLSVFTFNADWRIEPHDDSASVLTHNPHPNLTTIGLHGLLSAFGVGYLAARSPDDIRTRIVHRSNDLNMSALNRHNFPKLRCVRALSRFMLQDLNKADGPSRENGGYDRWSRWWSRCAASGIRLEDCTGQLLGNLPQDDEDEEKSEDESNEEESEEEVDDNDDDWGTGSEEESDYEYEFSVPPLPEGNGRTMELTRLLQEVRAMNETRDESLIARIRIPRPESPL
ncbi:hypothetical protein GALMADRAFT_80689 [Galerina marginata CBS 339.88]|uniref:F-box domain-containing protein n=1 Tax=Galerina marginata (strain CBS 339.88) TaxID=685588 RepID=A0A067SFN7_GALM3|nr:hypothetical protein GALMADRAFT_80689 [Galerina marginata CBS 339.88]